MMDSLFHECSETFIVHSVVELRDRIDRHNLFRGNRMSGDAHPIVVDEKARKLLSTKTNWNANRSAREAGDVLYSAESFMMTLGNVRSHRLSLWTPRKIPGKVPLSEDK